MVLISCTMGVDMLLNVLLICIIGGVVSVEVHFENKDGGFFLKHASRGVLSPPMGAPSPSGGSGGAPLSVDRFTVFQTARAVSVRATYGPFSTKQTVPARSLVPDPSAVAPPGTKNTSLDQPTVRLDMSAHVVAREISRDVPVIRVLFHAGGREGGARACGVVHASAPGRAPLVGACAPDAAGACLAQLRVPAAWWPALQDAAGTSKPAKRPPRFIQLAYSVLEPRGADTDGGNCMPRVQIQPAARLGAVQLVEARAPWRELRADDSVSLLVPRAPLYPLSRLHLPVFVKHSAESPVTLFIMKARVKSGLRLLGATAASDQWTITVDIKAKGATVTAVRKEALDQQTPPRSEEVFTWSVEAGGGAGRGLARLSCSVRYARAGTPLHAAQHHLAVAGGGHDGHAAKLTVRLDVDKDDIQAVLPISKNWEVLNTAVITGRQVSQAMKVLIVSQAGQVADVTLQSSCHAEDESVLKVSSSCSSVYVDGSEIRGSSNASVIVKYGTYTGLARFTVWMPDFPLEVEVLDFRLSQIKGWRVPEEGAGSGGKMAVGRRRRRRRSYGEPDDLGNSVTSDKHSCRLRFQQSPVDVYARFLATDHDSGRVSYLVSRRTWLRVTELVLPLLRVADPRLAVLRGRSLQGRAPGRTEVQVLSPITGRVIGAREIRVGSDKVSISRLIVRVISGLQLNITPDSAIENGYISETTVTRRLTAQYQEGLLDIDIEFSDGSRTPLRDVAVADYVLKVESLDPDVVAFAPMVASHHPRVIAVGEGNGELLRVTLLLSEDCRGGPTKVRGGLSDKSVSVAGVGSLGAVLASAPASVQVDFTSSEQPQRPDTPQNDDVMRSGNKGPLADLHDILIGIPLKDENNHEPTVQARQLGGTSSRNQRSRHTAHMTHVEIGMYVLLAAFCFAIVIFVVSCVVYASKFKPMLPESALGGSGLGPAVPLQPVGEAGRIQVAGLIGTGLGIAGGRKQPTARESTTNAHDWVWLGRATIERHTGHQIHAVNRTSAAQLSPPPPPPHASDIANRNTPNPPASMRITGNPLNLNYADPEDAIKRDRANVLNANVTSFDNPTHLELPSVGAVRARSHSTDNRCIDSTTYCKRDKSRNGRFNGSDNTRSWQPDLAPPLPPHAVPLESRHLDPEEYRPPVPPHRTPPPTNNTHKVLADTIMPPSRRSQRHHWKSDKPSQACSPPPHPPSPRKPHNRMVRDKQPPVEAPAVPLACVSSMNGNDAPVSSLVDSISCLNKEDCSGMFEFEDAPRNDDYMKDSGIGLSDVVYRSKPPGHLQSDKSDTANAQFVEIAGEKNASTSLGTSPEVKRATIVGNPMFSGSPCDREDANPESLGLDELQMDYEQIMHYFHNLKESNA